MKYADKYVDAAPQASTTPHVSTMRQARDGLLARLKHWAIGQRDPIQAQLHEVERQGRGMARLMHAAGYLMLILFSVGSAVGICGTLVQRVVANGPLTWASLPDDIVITVSLMLVFCMDLGDIYAAFMIRLLATRRAKWTQYILHGLVILVATILEGGTFILMSFQYDNVIAGAVAALVIGRGIVAPLFAVYLNMARAIPVGVADIAYHSFLAAGQGVVRDTIVIANDSRASLAEKAELMSASAHVGSHEQETLDRIIAVAKKREDRAVPTLPEPRNRVYAASYAVPEPQPQEHVMRVDYRAMHGDADGYDTAAIPDEVDYEDDDPGVTGVFHEDELLDGYDGQTTQPRNRARSASNPAPAKKTRTPNKAISEGMKRSHKERKAEGRERRQRTIETDVYAVLDEWYSSGSPKGLTDRKLADKVYDLGHLTVRPSENNVSRYRSKWEITRKREALTASVDADMDANAAIGEPDMTPDLELEEALP